MLISQSRVLFPDLGIFMENRQEKYEDSYPTRQSESFDLPGLCEEKPEASFRSGETVPTQENGISHGHLRRKSINASSASVIPSEIDRCPDDSNIPEAFRSRDQSGSGDLSCALRSVNSVAEDPENAAVNPQLTADKSNFNNNGRDLSTLGGNANIPRRPRGVLRRKNSPNIVKETPDRPVSIRGSRSRSGYGKLSSHSNFQTEQTQFSVGKRKKRYDDKENGSSRCNSAEQLKKENDFSLLKIYKKAKRSHRHKPGASTEKTEDAASESHSFGDFHEDDEESLERNAARMLSSRFDPRCMEDLGEKSTYYSSSSLSSSPSSSSSSSSLAQGVHKRSASLRLRENKKKQRHFYEVCTRAVDPHWVLNRQISVFWPLDQSWYVGLVNDYNPTTKLHHVKFDDREEEWIDLQGERFKILLLPSEFTSKFCHGKLELKLKEENVDGSMKGMDDNCLTSVLDSEPIISWLARSTNQPKTSNPNLKKKKDHTTGRLSSIISPDGEKDEVPSQKRKRKCYDDMKFSLVYFRRRFGKRAEKLENKREVRDDPFDFTFSEKLSCITQKHTEKKLKFILPPQWVSPLTWLSEYSWICRNYLLHRHSKLIPLWPQIHMEMVLLDNTLGLRFLSLKGHLLRAVKVLCLFARIFHQLDWSGKLTAPQLPLTSVGFKLSCVQSEGRQLFFCVYKFVSTDSSQWLNLGRKLKQLSVKIKVLPLSDRTYTDLKELFHANEIKPLNPEKNRKMSKEGLHIHSRMNGHAKIRPFSPSFSPAPSLFLFLHFKFLARKKASLTRLKTDDSVPSDQFSASAVSPGHWDNSIDSYSHEKANGSKSLTHGKREHSKRRRPNTAKDSGVDFLNISKKSVDSLSCRANILVTTSDRGWRERDAHVVIDSDAQKDLLIIVKVSGERQYFHKPLQPLQPGATNRFTHALLWKGGKDWILEFADRKEWAVFKEMYQECCDLNVRAASVRHIPIPGVSLIKDYDSSANGLLPFVRSSSYFRQSGTELDAALDRSIVIYDLDSDDEEWISRNAFQGISEEMVEKVMDVLEKEAFLRRRVEFEEREIEEMMNELFPMEMMKAVYEHWLQRRRSKGTIPLIRQFQPPLWEQYRQQLREWESEVNGRTPSVDKSKPPMFAFCLRPRGLELPNKYAKQRSHKKLPFQGKRPARPLSKGTSAAVPSSYELPDAVQSPTARSDRSSSKVRTKGSFPTARQKLERFSGRPGGADELMLRDAVTAAQHLSSAARFKREKANWLMHRADVAIHRAVSLLVTAEAMDLVEEEETETESSDLGGAGRVCSGLANSSPSDQEDGSLEEGSHPPPV